MFSIRTFTRYVHVLLGVEAFEMTTRIQKYLDLDFLKNLIDTMMTSEFSKRPTALVALHHWYRIKIQLDVSIARWRLRRRNESVGERVVLDTVDVARQGIHGLKRLFNGDVSRASGNPKPFNKLTVIRIRDHGLIHEKGY